MCKKMDIKQKTNQPRSFGLFGSDTITPGTFTEMLCKNGPNTGICRTYALCWLPVMIQAKGPRFELAIFIHPSDVKNLPELPLSGGVGFPPVRG